MATQSEAQSKSAGTVRVHRVKDWEKHYEGAKTKTYNNKTTCSMPNKHGLGYRKLIRMKNGASLFGAWCALIQVLSRHEKPRKGYCTDDGSVHGKPYTSDDLEMLTDIKASIFKELFSATQVVGWMVVTEVKDTTRIPQETIVSPQYPLNSDSDLNSDLPPNPQGGSIDDFIQRFNEATGRNFRIFADKTRRQLKARLRDGYTIDEILQAAKNASQDQYHKENPRFLTPEFITREDKLSSWLNAGNAQKNNAPTMEELGL